MDDTSLSMIVEKVLLRMDDTHFTKMSATLKPPFFLDEDQAWTEAWLAFVLQSIDDAGLEQQGNINFLVVYENGKLVAPKKTKEGKLFGTMFTWKEQDLSSDDIMMLFWRPEDNAHLQQWLARCDSGLKECEGKEVHQVMISIWIPLDHATPSLRGKLDAGNHVPFSKFTHEVVFDFSTLKQEEEVSDLLATPTPEQREKLMRELEARRHGPLI
jgi:hypothetical protein